MNREPVRETAGKPDKTPLFMKLYFHEVYTEVARVVGYAGFPCDQLEEEMKDLVERFGRKKIQAVSWSDAYGTEELFALLGVGLVEPDGNADAAGKRSPFFFRSPGSRRRLLYFRGHVNLPFSEGTVISDALPPNVGEG